MDRVEWHGTVSTTMELARERALAGVSEGTTIVAESQTAGRGRLGREWYSPRGAGLWLTTILRPQPGPGLATIALVAGVATLEAAHRLGASGAQVKWPNDVVVGERKLAGILVQGEEVQSPVPVVLLGVGFNLGAASELDLPEGLSELYVGLDDLGYVVSPRAALAELLPALERRYAEWAEGGVASIFDAWHANDALAGKPVRAQSTSGMVEGIAMGLAAGGELRIQTADGEALVQSGDVTQVRGAGLAVGHWGRA